MPLTRPPPHRQAPRALLFLNRGQAGLDPATLSPLLFLLGCLCRPKAQFTWSLWKWRLGPVVHVPGPDVIIKSWVRWRWVSLCRDTCLWDHRPVPCTCAHRTHALGDLTQLQAETQAPLGRDPPTPQAPEQGSAAAASPGFHRRIQNVSS